MKAGDMDLILHHQRLAAGVAAPPVDARDITALPDGAVMATDDRFFAKRNGGFLEWTFHGYRTAAPPESARLVTPTATVVALRAGYLPVWHPSAAQAA
jgi:hypothetical protein